VVGGGGRVGEWLGGTAFVDNMMHMEYIWRVVEGLDVLMMWWCICGHDIMELSNKV